MSYDIGPKIGLEGEAEFRNAIKQINTNLKTLGTEMLAVTSQFDKNDKSMEALTTQNKVLNKQIDEQKGKLSELQKGLQASAEKYGENDKVTQGWQQAVNKATADLNNMERQLSDNTNEIEKALNPTQELADEVEETGKSAEESGGRFEKLGGILKASAAAMGAFAVAAGAAAIKLGKDVISEFGSYEQLVGGVDTLFKESSSKLQGYAADAYKTAGLDANSYMETVTGFSASLIQSLGGDTEKSVEYANMAITDMSDNANKMGTDMASIQNAYQGFAKQNYTMLDNLKLGYGGTKSEMERLLADATAISGIKYDVSSYADVVEAIHIIQESMGIAGTTALEAEDTIEGSLNSLNSAVKNMLVGFGNADADMQKLTENLVDAFKMVVKNITPVIGNIANALPDAFSAISPAIGELLPDLLGTVTNLTKQILDILLKTLPELIPVAIDSIAIIVDTLIDNLPLLIDAAITLIMALSGGMVDALPELIPAVIAMTVLLVTELIKRIPEILEFVPRLFTNLGEAFKTVEWASLGADLMRGIVNGMMNLKDWVVDKVKEVAGSVAQGFKDFFKIASPSKLMIEYGRYIDEGLAEGIEKNKGKPVNETQLLAEAVGNALQMVNKYVTATVSILQKEFNLWVLQNDAVTESSEYLVKQLDMQKQEHEMLNQRIEATTHALQNAITQYGEGSIEAMNYKNALLDLQIQQAGLTEKIEETTKAIKNMADAQTTAKIAAADKQSSSERSASQSRYQEEKKNFEDNYAKEINAYSKLYDVDKSVAAEILKKDLQKSIPKYATGTNNHPGGWAIVGDGNGPELVNLPRGSQVFSHEQSKDMLKLGDTNIYIYNPQPRPSELARQIKKSQQDLALQYDF